LVAVQQPPLVLAGDYFTASTFTGCVTSAFAAVAEAAPLLEGFQPRKAKVEAEQAAPSSAPEDKQKQSTRWGTRGQQKESGEGVQPRKAKVEAEQAAPSSAPEDKQKQSIRWGTGGHQKESGEGNTRCNQCKKSAKCFKDTSDGKMYCASCWKDYYGTSPMAGA